MVATRSRITGDDRATSDPPPPPSHFYHNPHQGLKEKMKALTAMYEQHKIKIHRTSITDLPVLDSTRKKRSRGLEDEESAMRENIKPDFEAKENRIAVLSCPKKVMIPRKLSLGAPSVSRKVGGELGVIPEKGEAGSRIKVFVRLRPMSKKEKEAGSRSCVKIMNKKDVYLTEFASETDYLRLNRLRGRHFCFDTAFPDTTSQQEVYSTTTSELVEGVLQGRNGSVFCYGATGAGKTYTMLGMVENPGVMVLAIKDLFAKIRQRSYDGNHLVHLSYLEVYNETVRDLLSPGRPLILREDKQALQIISLCGWEPRLLPYVVDCQKQSNILTKRPNSSTSSAQMPGIARQKVIVQSSSIPGGLEVGKHIHPSLGEDRHDPASVVLDCRFCGACVGLWAFPTTNCPMEIFRLVADYSDQTESAVRCLGVVCGAESSKTQNSGEGNLFTEKGFAIPVYDGSTTKERPMGLNFTIAGGPLPAEQNFRPRVSFPVISRHLRADLGNIPGAGNCIGSSISCGNQVNSRCHDAPSTTRKDTHDVLVCQPEGLGKRKRSEDSGKSDCVVNEAKTAGVFYEQGMLNLQETHSMHECSSGTMQNLKEFIGNRTGDLDRTEISSKELAKEGLNTEVNADDNDEVRESTFTTNPNEIIPASKSCENRSRSGAAVVSNLNDSSLPESNSYHVESLENNHLDPAPSCSATNTTLSNTPKSPSDGKVYDSCNLGDAQVNGKKVDGLESKTLSSINEADTADYELGNYELARYPNMKGFDPIHQHRPFCPWTVTEMAGWKLTLSALIKLEKDDSQPSGSEAPSTQLDEEDDPLISVRKLFMSPAKRLKSSQ